jgi:hypothetical protein
MTEETRVPPWTGESYLDDHAHTSNASEAHCIDDERIFEFSTDKVGPALCNFDLAAVQAVGDVHREKLFDAVLVDEKTESGRTTEYYYCTSQTFYEIARMARDAFDVAIEVENVRTIADLHTEQFLDDLYDYEFDMDSVAPVTRTVCTAMNDDTPYSGRVTQYDEPDGANYGYVDARGLVIERGTHQ